MSVLLNITMPKTCEVCPCNDDNWRCGATWEYFDYEDTYERRRADCPLVEIPTPHGNLKDESDIISLIEVMFCKDNDGMEHAIQCVKDAPTVIEAEGSET